ncbi:Chaperone protein dnaJ [Coemansia aciculifera]|uniref:Chaperone protein dnaJ n=1 Tax=Coemansia aciculifera TaxID=417176 RepID=A0ACC1M7V0_9FUNG|nr:Chaperone protein dnaJ [Coemansia aciculifera]KAJ2910928.1 Chaperone protein dnaJ [Coemansia aciculifera]
MEVNRDEAARALDIAQKKRLAGDTAGALRIARKSHSLYPTTLSEKLIAEYEKSQIPATEEEEEEEQQQQQPDSELRSRASAKPKGTTSSEDTNKRTHTPQQLAAVRAVISAKHDYYKVLGAERSATDAELKRAYRRSALLFHPDKNFAPGADEAFKLVAHAFTILSDADKRAHYDRFGVADKSSDYASTAAAQHQQQYRGRRQAAGGGGFDDEISPEDLFNMFFGGGAGNGRFGVQFGPNVRFAQNVQAANNHFRRQQTDDDDSSERSLRSACMQFVPLVFLVFLFFGSSLLSILLGSNSMPSYAFTESPPQYTQQRHTRLRKVSYWVDPAEFARSYPPRKDAGYSFRDVRYFENEVEAQYVSQLQLKCRQEKEQKRLEIYKAQGWFGIGNDRVKLEAAINMPLPACEELKRFR